MLQFNQSRLTQAEEAKMHADDRIITLKVKEGEKATTSSGLVDPRLFKGGNTLHALRSPENSMWFLKYDSGALPPPLKQHFTSLSKLMEFTRGYFSKRNIEIVEIKDNYAAEPSQ